MLKKFINLVIFLSQLRDPQQMHYKLATINGETGCVEANMGSKIAKKLQATPGRCSYVQCLTYKGQYKIPACCTVSCFTCERYI